MTEVGWVNVFWKVAFRKSTKIKRLSDGSHGVLAVSADFWAQQEAIILLILMQNEYLKKEEKGFPYPSLKYIYLFFFLGKGFFFDVRLLVSLSQSTQC